MFLKGEKNFPVAAMMFLEKRNEFAIKVEASRSQSETKCIV